MLGTSRTMTAVVILLSAVSVLTLLLPSVAEVLHFIMVTATVVLAVVMVSNITGRLQ